MTSLDIFTLHLEVGLYLQETVAARSGRITTGECAVGSIDVTLLRDAIKPKFASGADLPRLHLRLTQEPVTKEFLHHLAVLLIKPNQVVSWIKITQD